MVYEKKQPIQGDEDYRAKSLETARQAAQAVADKFQVEVGIFRNQEGTALHREVKFIQPGIIIEETINPSQPDLPTCPACLERAKSSTEPCKKCQKKAKK